MLKKFLKKPDLSLRHLNGAKLEDGVQIKSSHRLKFGKNIIIQCGAVLHGGDMDWCPGQGLILIGDNSVISPYCVIYGAGEVRIGQNFDCGPHVGIYSHRTDYKKGMGNHLFAPIKIGDNVTVFAGAIINCGVTIGDNAVIAAGSVILENVGAGEFWAGTPAKFIKKVK